MYNKLLIVISYYLDRFLLLSYPPPPIWGKGSWSPFPILSTTPLLWAHFVTISAYLSSPYWLRMDWISVFLQFPQTHNVGNNRAVLPQNTQHYNLHSAFTFKSGLHTATPLCWSQYLMSENRIVVWAIYPQHFTSCIHYMPGKADSFSGYVWAHVPLGLQTALQEFAVCLPALSCMEGLCMGSTGMAQVRGSWEAVQLLPGWSRAQLNVTQLLCLYNGALETLHLFVKLQL